jgi:ataxia telangiectasia mutated family protein
MEQMFDVANQLLSKNQLTQHLNMRTYKVLPLSQRSGLVEWCENTMPIGVYLVGRGRDGAHAKYRPKDTKSSDVRAILKACRDKNQVKLPMEYKRQCAKFKPVFRHYFTENF